MPSIRIGLSTQFNLENEQVGIGTTNPTATLEVIGNIVAEGAAGGSGVSTFREYQGFHQSEQGIANNIVIDNQTGGPFSSLSADLVISGETTISSGSTVEIGKTKTLTVTDKFAVPFGDTNSRDSTPEAGTTRFNQDFGTLEFFDGNNWKTVNSYARGGAAGRCVMFGGTFDYPNTDTAKSIDFVNINTLGNAQNFGDLTAARAQTSACASATRGLCMGSNYPTSNIIEYVTIAAGGNSSDFGDCNRDVQYGGGGFSSSTRGFIVGGWDTTPSPGGNIDKIDYVEISTLGNMQNFGDLTNNASRYGPAFSSPVRGFYVDGSGSPRKEINVWTMASQGNSIDWGDATDSPAQLGGSSNSVRGVYLVNGDDGVMTTIDQVSLSSLGNAIYFGDLGRSTGADIATGSTQTRAIFAGGFASPALTNMTNIDYVTIMTAGNAQDFGELIGKGAGKSLFRGCSDSHGGLGGF